MRTFEELFNKYKKEFKAAYPSSKELEHYNAEALFYTGMVYLARELLDSKYATLEMKKEFEEGLPRKFMQQ